MGIQKEDDKNPPLPLLRDEEVIQAQPDQRGITERYVEECVRFMRDNKDQSFFLYLAHMHVHLPHYPPEAFVRESENGVYGAAVACIDWAAAVIFDELKSLGLDDNTLVIFTSDNGSRARDEGGSNSPLRATKGTTWEGGQRVPCLMRWPGKIPAGEVCNELTLSMDFYPTLAAIGGAEVPTDRIIDGKDIRPLSVRRRRRDIATRILLLLQAQQHRSRSERQMETPRPQRRSRNPGNSTTSKPTSVKPMT